MNTKPLTLSRYIITTLKPYKTWLCIMAFVGLLWAVINTLTPYTLKLIIDHVARFQGGQSQLIKTVQPFALAYIVLWVIQFANMRLLDWTKMKLLPQVREDIMSGMFRYLNLHSHHFFQNNFAGSLSNKIGDMHNGVVEIINVMDDMYAQALGITVAIITLLFVHPIFAAILLGWTLTFLFITFLFLKPIQKLSHVFSESATAQVGKMVDSISNITNIRLFARHKEENQYINKSIQDAVSKDRNMQAKIIKMRIFWDFTILALLGLNIYVLVSMYSKNLVTIGDFTFVITLSVSILWSLWFLAGQFVTFSEQIGRCKQALSILSKPHDIVDAPTAKPLKVTEGRIQFKNVSFHYDEGIHLFKNKNIQIEPGQKVGLVGFSGSGKSTFVNLILRLFELESGTITIDGQNINEVTQQSLREHIALIPQDITLFHRTLMENIRFGNTLATDEEIMAISKKAHCHEFISELKDGYQSMVGERGIKLSGGQRQRIAIARAMLKNAPILILDEATSALDSVTEQYIQESLHELMENKTTIVIAHRLSTLSEMDRILVFYRGEIVEDGTHETLIAKNGQYAKMWRMQAGGFLPEEEQFNL